MSEKKEKVFEVSTSGRLNINNTKKFLEMLSGADPEVYEKLMIYGKKNLNQRATDIPFIDQEMIINFAIVKTMNSYDASAGANFLTYFTNKLRGEVSDYRNKRDSMTNKIHKLANSGTEEYAKSFDKESQTTTLERVDNETPEEKLMAQDIYRRKLQAFRMAFSGIPLYSQNILNKIVISKQKLYELAEQEGVSVQEISRVRNNALSLIFVRVLRSNHLDEEEKAEIRKEHDLA
jgi:DNA-directed RNA polymerase specialized sigma subunit